MSAGSHPASPPPPGTSGPARRPRRLWRWFAGGFLLVFLGMLLLATVPMMHPSGQYVQQYPLWRYYGRMVPRTFVRSAMGPASGGTPDLIVTGGFHLLCSA